MVVGRLAGWLQARWMNDCRVDRWMDCWWVGDRKRLWMALA